MADSTQEGLPAARGRGRLGGRSKADLKAIQQALVMYHSGDIEINDILKRLGISRTTLYKY